MTLSLRDVIADAIWTEIQYQAKNYVVGNPMSIEQAKDVVEHAADRVMDTLRGMGLEGAEHLAETGSAGG